MVNLTTRQKKTIIVSVAIALVVIISMTSVSYAWFVQGILSDKFRFTVAYVETKVTIERGEDSNQDGNLDVDELGMPLYTHLGDSLSGAIKLDDKGKPIIIDGVPQYDPKVKVKMEIKKFMPSQIYNWRITIQNTGDVKGKVNAALTIDLDPQERGIDVLSVRLNQLNKVYFGNCYGSDMNTGKRTQIVPVVDNVILDYSKGELVNPESIGIYMIKIEFETFEALIENGVNITQAEYQSYMGRVFNSLNLYVTIEDYSTTKN